MSSNKIFYKIFLLNISKKFKVGGKSYLKPSRDFHVSVKCFPEVGGIFPEAYLELCQASQMGRFAKIVKR